MGWETALSIPVLHECPCQRRARTGKHQHAKPQPLANRILGQRAMHRPRGQGRGIRSCVSLFFSTLGNAWLCECPSRVFWRSCPIPRHTGVRLAQYTGHRTHYPAAAFGDTKSPGVEFTGSTAGYAFSTCNHLMRAQGLL